MDMCKSTNICTRQLSGVIPPETLLEDARELD